MDALKHNIYEVAQHMVHINTKTGKETNLKIMGEQIPQNFRILEEKLHDQQKQKLANRQIPILTRDEFLSIAGNLNGGKDALLNEDIPTATKFLHNIGNFLLLEILRNLYHSNRIWNSTYCSLFILIEVFI